jgi:hypothetical protein
VRWSCTALALTIAAQTGLRVSRETIRLELRAAGYVWKRAKLSARNDDPQRALRLAQIYLVIEHLQPSEAFFWCDELDIHLLAKVGYQWTLNRMLMGLRVSHGWSKAPPHVLCYCSSLQLTSSLYSKANATLRAPFLRACFRRTRSALIACGHEQPTLP